MERLHSWTFKTVYTDKARNKVIKGKSKVYAYQDDKLRMELYDPFGFVTVGFLILNGDMMRAKIISGKEYRGSIKEKKIKDIIKVDINPKDIISVFTQSGFKENLWECSVGENNMLRECFNQLQKVKIKWNGSMSQEGTVATLDHAKAKLEFEVRSYQSFGQVNLDIFKP